MFLSTENKIILTIAFQVCETLMRCVKELYFFYCSHKEKILNLK